MLLLQSRKRVKILTRLSVSCNQCPQRRNTTIHLSSLKISAYVLKTCSWPELMFRVTVIINQRWKVHKLCLYCFISQSDPPRTAPEGPSLFYMCRAPVWDGWVVVWPPQTADTSCGGCRVKEHGFGTPPLAFCIHRMALCLASSSLSLQGKFSQDKA